MKYAYQLLAWDGRRHTPYSGAIYATDVQEGAALAVKDVCEKHAAIYPFFEGGATTLAQTTMRLTLMALPEKETPGSQPPQ